MKDNNNKTAKRTKGKERRVRGYHRFINYGGSNECDVCNDVDRRLVSANVLSERTGMITRKSEYVQIDREAEMKNYCVSDFSLTNMLAIGANLTDVGSVTGNRFNAISNLERQAESLLQKEANN